MSLFLLIITAGSYLCSGLLCVVMMQTRDTCAALCHRLTLALVSGALFGRGLDLVWQWSEVSASEAGLAVALCARMLLLLCVPKRCAT
jgi:hypothetical protein